MSQFWTSSRRFAVKLRFCRASLMRPPSTLRTRTSGNGRVRAQMRGTTVTSQGKGTTNPGYENPNGQIVVHYTGHPGTDHNQFVYELRCKHCGQVYGANGSDIHERKCPNCQGGRPGIPL